MAYDSARITASFEVLCKGLGAFFTNRKRCFGEKKICLSETYHLSRIGTNRNQGTPYTWKHTNLN